MDFNSYYNDFVFWLSKSLKPGWGIEMKLFPFVDGAIIVINMKRGIAHNLFKYGQSNNLGDALRKTKLFSDNKIRPIADMGVEKTMYGIFSTTQYVLFKDAMDNSWDEASAQSDVETIISKVKEKYGKH